MSCSAGRERVSAEDVSCCVLPALRAEDVFVSFAQCVSEQLPVTVVGRSGVQCA